MAVTGVLIFTLMQATTVSSPPSEEMRRMMAEAGTAQVRTADAAPSRSRGSEAKPVLVADNWIPTRTSLMRSARGMAENATRQKGASIVPAITTLPYRDCRKIADHPRGFLTAAGTALNGRRALFDCGGFMADVVRSDYRRPLKGVTSTGFPPSELAAVINGGATAKTFQRNAAGRTAVAYQWIGRGHSIELTLTAEAMDAAALARAADTIIDGLTRADRS